MVCDSHEVLNRNGHKAVAYITSAFLAGCSLFPQHDRPTITYAPLTGDQYVGGMMTPIRPEQLFSAILAAWPANVILFIRVESINGLTNQSFGRMVQRAAADPRFLRLLELTRKLQLSGALGFRIREAKEKDTKNIVFFRNQNLSEEEARDARETNNCWD